MPFLSDSFMRIELNQVSVNEVEALFELYKEISCSIIDDGLIHKVQKEYALPLQFLHLMFLSPSWVNVRSIPFSPFFDPKVHRSSSTEGMIIMRCTSIRVLCRG